MNSLKFSFQYLLRRSQRYYLSQNQNVKTFSDYVGLNRDLKVRTATTRDHETIVDFLLDNFRVEEPITKAMGLNRNQVQEVFSMMAMEALQDEVSFVVHNSQQELICCRLSSIIHTNKHKEEFTVEFTYREEATLSELSMKTRQLVTFLDMFEKDINQTIPQANKLFKLMIVSVRADHFRQGIAKDLYPKSVQLSKEYKCEGMCTTATSHRTQRLYTNIGFKPVKTIYHKDYKDESGRQIIVTDDETKCAQLLYKNHTNNKH